MIFMIKKTNHFIFICLAFWLIISFTQAQVKDIGTPFIKNFERSKYNAGQQTWMIDHNRSGKMYFANNEGLLEFDGHSWDVYNIPNGSVIHCLLISGDGRIYVGGFNEFGYFKADSIGELQYHSMTKLLQEENRDFDEIWRIHLTPDGLIFQSFTKFIVFNEDNIQVIPAPKTFHFSFFINGQLLICDIEKGLLRFAMGQFFPLHGTEKLKGKEIWAILPFNENLLIATAESGLFLYDGDNLKEWITPASEFLKKNQLYCAIRIDEKNMCFGTIQNGLMICNNEGIPSQIINRQKGLQNNTILSLKIDRFGNLWLGTDNGIDYIEINSSLSLLSYCDGLSAGYTAVLHKGILYFGTNQGVFYKKWDNFLAYPEKENNFKLIESTRGQVWELQVFDGQLFCGHNNGTFLIEGEKARKIAEIQGGWTYLQLNGHPDKIIGGTYSGLILFTKESGEWSYTCKIKGYNESSRIMEADFNGSLWMSHGLKGVYNIFLNNSLDSVVGSDFYNSSNGFISDHGINVSELKGNIVFSSPNGIFKFNYDTKHFVPDTYLNDLLPKLDVRKLFEDEQGDIWYFSEDNSGVLRIQEDGSYLDINLPFRQLEGSFVKGFQFVYSLDESNIFFGTENGFVHYDPLFNKDYNKDFNVYINRVNLSKPDSILYFGQGNIDSNELTTILDAKYNSLDFEFSANDYENLEMTHYSTFLEGYDEGWSNWDVRYNREFTNLKDGDYSFFVKARNIYNVETQPAKFSFTINPPWIKTLDAIIIFSCIVLLFLFAMFHWMRKRIERSKKKVKLLQQQKSKEKEDELRREALEAEKEIIRLRNEALREKMTMKDKELANSTMQMIQKNKLLNKIKNEIKNIASIGQDEDQRYMTSTLIRKINKDINSENQWEVFETHFENVHEAFLKRLKNQYPELTPRELKLCAYLRMNISSKEIALLMNISTRGVEISRYRLRKKLNLDRVTNLTDFILSF